MRAHRRCCPNQLSARDCRRIKAPPANLFSSPLPPCLRGRKMVFCYSELSTSLINSVLRTLPAASLHSSYLSTLIVHFSKC